MPAQISPCLDGRLGDAEHRARVLHADVVAGEAARKAHAAAVVQRQVRADHLPALAAVASAVHVLAPYVDRLVVVRGDVHGGIPDEAVPDTLCRAPALLRPHLDAPPLAPFLLVAHHDAAHHARPGGRGPDDVGVDRIRGGKPALAAAHVMPHAARNAGDAPLALDAAVAGPPVGGLVLLVAEDVVGDLVVHRHVIHLRVGEALAEPRPAAVDGDGEALVVRDDHAVAVAGVDPHVVVVAAGRVLARDHVDRAAAVGRDREGGGQEVRLVLVVGRDHDPRVVVRPAHGVAVAGDALPGAAAVGGAPHLPVLGLAAVPRNPVAGLKHRVDALRVRGRDRHRDLAHRQVGQPDAVVGPIQLLPGVAAVARDVQAAAGSAAGAPVGVNLELPRPREEVARVDRVERDVGAAGVLVHEEDALPALAAVRGAVDAALLLRAVGMPQRADVDDVGIGRMDGEPGNAARLLQPHERPGPAGVGRLVDALPDGDVAADLTLAGTGPDDVGIGRGHPQRADRLHWLVVEDGVPVHAAVGRLVDASGGGAHVVGVGVARQAGGRGEAVAFGPDVAPLEVGVGFGGGSLLGGGRRGGRDQGQQEQEGGHAGCCDVHGAARGMWMWRDGNPESVLHGVVGNLARGRHAGQV